MRLIDMMQRAKTETGEEIALLWKIAASMRARINDLKASGDTIAIPNVGTFHKVHRKARRMRNIRYGFFYTAPATDHISMRCSKYLKGQVN
jgi:nucleoid DNA-binding protein